MAAKYTDEVLRQVEAAKAQATFKSAERSEESYQRVAAATAKAQAKKAAGVYDSVQNVVASIVSKNKNKGASLGDYTGQSSSTGIDVKPYGETVNAPTIEKASAKAKANAAKTALEEYLNSEERKQRAAEQAEKQQEQFTRQILSGVAGIPEPQIILDEKEQQLIAEAEKYKAEADAAEEEEIMQTDLDAIASMSEEERSLLEQYAVNQVGDQNMPIEMVGVLPTAKQQAAGLIAKYGQKRVDELAETYMRQQNAELAQKADEKARQQANEHGVLSSLATIPVAAVSGVVGTVGQLQGLARDTGRYKTADPNATGTIGDVYTGAVRGQVAQNIAGDVYDENGDLVQEGGRLKGALSIGYQGVMSMADSIARAYLGGGAFGGAALAATNTFSQSMADASRQGATPAQAALLATANAAIEAASEKIPLDDLIKTAKGGNATSVIKNVLRQAGIEAATEEVSLVGSLLAEAAILQEKSGYNQTVTTQLLMGKSYEEAREAAAKEIFDEAVNTALVSAVAGVGGGLSASYAAEANLLGGPENETEVQQAQPETQTVQEAQEAPQAAETAQPMTEQEKVQRGINQQMEDLGRQAAGIEQPTQGTETAQAEGKIPEQNAPQQTKTAAQETSAPQADTQEQSAEGGQIKGTGAAERNFSGVAEYENMLTDGNIQKERPNAVRNVEIPKRDSDGKRVTEFASNAVSAGVTPDRMADAIKSLIGDKQLSFDTRTNKQSLDNAAQEIGNRGEQTVISELAAHAANGAIVDGDVEKGLVLYAKYANDPDYQETASAIFTDLATVANMSGRNLQMFSLMKRMTPEGQLMTVRKNIEKSVEKINKGRSGRKQITFNPYEGNLEAAKKVAQKRNVVIDESLEQSFLDAKTEEQKKAALDDIYKNVASQIKPTLGEMWDAWRNLAMLGNIKTHERNVGSTAAFQPYVMVKRNIAAALEKALIKQKNRTKSVLGIGKETRALLAWAKEDAKSESVKNLLGGASATGDEARSAIQDYRKILPGVLDTARKKNMDIMEREDGFFKRGEYARSLASFLKARGYTVQQIQNESVPKGVLDAARQYAVKEAQKATFNDRNEFSDTISKLNNVKNEGGGVVLNIVRKGIVPFLRTPANVVKRVAEYNPLTMAKTLITAKSDIDSGRKSASDVIDQVSAGLTGTAAMGLGAALAAGMVPGVELVGSVEDEDELREGAQEYSIRIGDKYYNVAWLAPAMIPLFIGANLYNKFSNLADTEEGVDGWDIAQAFLEVGVDTLNPMLELSMLSSLNDFVDNISNEETAGDKVMAAFLDAATSYFTQGIPTLFGQIEQASEAEKNTTYVNTDNDLERIVKETSANATRKLPGDLYQTKKLNEWGEVVENEGDFIDRAVNAFFNPFTVTERKNDDLTKEITRLNKAQETDVTPPYVSKVITYTDKNGNLHQNKRLTEEQYQTLATTQGQTAKRIVTEIINSEDYKALSDEQKAQAILYAYQYARETGEQATFPDSQGYSQAWMMEIKETKEAAYILNKVGTAMLSGTIGKLDAAWDNNYSAANQKALGEQLKADFEAYTQMSKEAKQEIYDEATGTTKKYIEAREKGVSHDDFLRVAKGINNVKGTGKLDEETGKNAVRDIDKRQVIASMPGLSDKARDTLMRAYMTDYDPNDESPTKTEPKYDFIREEMGLSSKEYTASYRAYLDTDGKWYDKNREIMEAIGCDYGTANKLRKLYGGSYEANDWIQYLYNYTSK